jgi:hypothetical protein
MQRDSRLVDPLGNPIRPPIGPEHPIPQALSHGEKKLAIGSYSLGFVAAGESSLLALFPMSAHPTVVVILGIQSALFVFVGVGLGVYLSISHLTGITWSIRYLSRQPIIWLFIPLLLLLTIPFGWQVIRINRLQVQLDPLNARLSNDEAQLNSISTSTLASDQAALININNLAEDLKKQALTLASALISRAATITILAGQHPFRGSWPPGSPEPAREMRQVLAAQTQSQIDAAQLLSDYKNSYSNHVIALRRWFMEQGQKDRRDEQYYANPSTVGDIQQIGHDLFEHASLLK